MPFISAPDASDVASLLYILAFMSSPFQKALSFVLGHYLITSRAAFRNCLNDRGMNNEPNYTVMIHALEVTWP